MKNKAVDRQLEFMHSTFQGIELFATLLPAGLDGIKHGHLTVLSGTHQGEYPFEKDDNRVTFAGFKGELLRYLASVFDSFLSEKMRQPTKLDDSAVSKE